MGTDTKKVRRLDGVQGDVNNEEIAHLAGFYDAVGNITVTVRKDSHYRIGYTIRPLLRVLRPDEDDPLLGKLMAYCEEERVIFNLNEQSHGSNRDNVSIKWQVVDLDSIERFLEPMMEYLVTNYYSAEAMLGAVLPAMREGQDKDKEGFIELMEIADELRTNKRGQVKYTKEYFEEEWSVTEQ